MFDTFPKGSRLTYWCRLVSIQNQKKHQGKEKGRKPLKIKDFRLILGCGGRTRTSGLRVMSPTSYQLLYPAVFSFSRYPELHWKGITRKVMSPTSYQLLHSAIFKFSFGVLLLYTSLCTNATLFFKFFKNFSQFSTHRLDFTPICSLQ